MKHLLPIILFLIGSLMSSPSEAKVSNGYHEDMLIDRHWYYERPWVPSDAHRGADMLPWIPVMINDRADVFDSFSGQKNMYGREDMFQNARLRKRVHHTLVIDP